MGVPAICRLQIVSPKRERRRQSGWEGFFPYYAGFPVNFADAILQSADLAASAVIFDPWNGSGTTTYAAKRQGLVSIGHDINPVMVAVARARMLPRSEADSLQPMAKVIVDGSRNIDVAVGADPLCSWFTRETAGALRRIERSLCHRLIGDLTLTPHGTDLDRLSGFAAAFFVALFAVCRDLAVPFQSSNPTWFRGARKGERRVRADRSEIESRFERHVAAMAHALASSSSHERETAEGEVRLMDSVSYAPAPNSIDLVLTSPPYCTRIDYTAATRVEIAVMSPLVGTNAEQLSRRMIGSTRVPALDIAPTLAWGGKCLGFLENVRSHTSKASKTYCWKTHLDYFDKMSKSLAVLSKALKPDAAAVFVVQDSYYKDVHNDLPAIFVDMAEAHSLNLKKRVDFYLRRSMADINPRTRVYERKSGAVESVLCFQQTAQAA
jgi:DNA methylase